MTPYKTNEAIILYSARQNNISNNNFQIADTCTHCVPIFLFCFGFDSLEKNTARFKTNLNNRVFLLRNYRPLIQIY